MRPIFFLPKMPKAKQKQNILTCNTLISESLLQIKRSQQSEFVMSKYQQIVLQRHWVMTTPNFIKTYLYVIREDESEKWPKKSKKRFKKLKNLKSHLTNPKNNLKSLKRDSKV